MHSEWPLSWSVKSDFELLKKGLIIIGKLQFIFREHSTVIEIIVELPRLHSDRSRSSCALCVSCTKNKNHREPHHTWRRNKKVKLMWTLSLCNPPRQITVRSRTDKNRKKEIAKFTTLLLLHNSLSERNYQTRTNEKKTARRDILRPAKRFWKVQKNKVCE